MKYRLYVDEVGNPDLNASKDPNHRYLSLTGVIMELEYVRTTVFPAIEALKEQYFASHPDDPLILHRKEKDTIGDVMAESRGGKEDRRLKDSFARLYEDGTDYVRPDKFAEHLTSKQLKVKPKSNNIAGLQIADLIAHPSFKGIFSIFWGKRGLSLSKAGLRQAQASYSINLTAIY